MNDVRITRKSVAVADKTSLSVRKKPVQSRSVMTLASLQDAFVRVLVDRGYEKMTIREVASVAGVGIGTFYDYVPNLKALAASSINKRCLECAEILRKAVLDQQGQPAGQVVHTLLKTLIELGFATPKEWTALLLLERQVSSAVALRKIHDAYVDIWADAFR